MMQPRGVRHLHVPVKQFKVLNYNFHNLKN